MNVYPTFVKDLERALEQSRNRVFPVDDREYIIPTTVLEGASPIEFPIESKTILGAIAFLALHESYHMGQLAYVRRFFDGTQLVG